MSTKIRRICAGVAALYFVATAAMAGEPAIKQRLVDTAPDGALAVLSIRDIAKFKTDFKNLKFSKIAQDPAFKPIVDDIWAFYMNELQENKNEPQLQPLFGILKMFNMTETELLDAVNGEVTVVVMDAPFAVKDQMLPDIVLSVDIHPKLSDALKDLKTIQGLFGPQMNQMGITTKSETTPEGVTINTMIVPLLQPMNATIAWTVLGNRLILADRVQILKDSLTKMLAAEATGGLLQSKDVLAMKAALQGDPAVLGWANFEKLYKVKEQLKPWIDNEGVNVLSLWETIGLTKVGIGMGFDKNGMFRESFFARVKDGSPITYKPIPAGARFVPPNGVVAWTQINIDIAVSYKQIMESFKMTGAEGERAMKDIKEAEEKFKVSFQNDISNALDGNVIVYFGMPYGSNGHFSHFLPDLIGKAKIKDKAAVEKLLDLLCKITADEGECFKPVNVAGRKGISLQRKDGESAEFEPTFIIDNDMLVVSMFNPQSAIRAMQSPRPGPKALTVSDAGLGDLVNDKTCAIFVGDLASFLEFGYNLLDFIQHVARMYPLVDFTKMPTDDKLSQYLGPVAAVSSIDGTVMQTTSVSPAGIVPSIVISAAAGYWYQNAAEMKKIETQTKQAMENMRLVRDRIKKFKAERGAMPNSLMQIYNTETDKEIFFFSGAQWEARDAEEAVKNNDTESFDRINAFYYDPTADGNAAQVMLSVKRNILDWRAKKFPAIMGDGSEKSIDRKQYESDVLKEGGNGNEEIPAPPDNF